MQQCSGHQSSNQFWAHWGKAQPKHSLSCELTCFLKLAPKVWKEQSCRWPFRKTVNAISDAGLETITNLGQNIANTLAKTFAKTLFALKVMEGEASTLMLSRKSWDQNTGTKIKMYFCSWWKNWHLRKQIFNKFSLCRFPRMIIPNFLKMLLLQQHQQPAFRPAFF